MANKVIVSPGVYTSEIDLTTAAQTIGLSSLGLVGETLKGPAFEPIEVSNYNEFRQLFGGTSPEKFSKSKKLKYELPYIAKSYLSEADRLFITRVLGLSGYDADKAWTIQTVGGVDTDTITFSPVVSGSTVASGATGTATTLGQLIDSGALTGLPAAITGNATLLSAFRSINITLTNGLDETTIFGDLSTSAKTSLEAFNGVPFTGATDEYQVQQTVNGEPFYDKWTSELFNYTGGTGYTGTSLGVATTVVASTGSTFNVSLQYVVCPCTASVITEGHNLVVATLRSDRTTFDKATALAPTVIMTSNETISAKSPLANITLSAGTDSYTVNFNKNSAAFIKNVISSAPGQKNTTIWVEEEYSVSLLNAFNNGKVRQLQSTITLNNVNLSNFKTKFKTAASPFVVSELRGNSVYQLFRVITISDGDGSNTDVKITIANISLERGEFDIIVRQFNDTDRAPIVLERFNRCTMNPQSNGYVAARVGTVDGTYALRSKYIMLEIAADAPVNAVPAGFEGYQLRDYAGSGEASPITYKTKYFENGDVISQKINTDTSNINAGLVLSSGDNQRFTYLGVSDAFGLDLDLVKFKGFQNTGVEQEFNTKSKGFHLDVSASTVSFEVGETRFTTENDLIGTTLEKLVARKFTFVAAGGFDGWDIYRGERSYGDGYEASTNPLSPYVVEGFANNNSDYYAFLNGILSFGNPEITDINLFATPGLEIFDNSKLIEQAVEMVEQRADSLYIATLSDSNPITGVVLTPEETVIDLEQNGIDSNYVATFYPWIQINDTENNTLVYIPPTAEVVRNMALTDKIAYPWFASAGATRGLVNARQPRIKLTQEQRDTLYLGRINPIAFFRGIGISIFGNKTLQSRDSALNRINVRRLLLQVRKLIAIVGNRLLFDQNDEAIRAQFLNEINPILQAVQRDRGISDYRVVLRSPAEEIDRNTLTGIIQLKPIGALEFIDLTFSLNDEGAAFDE